MLTSVGCATSETGTVYRYTYDASGNIRSMYSARVDSEGNETNGITREFYYTDGILTGYGFGSMAHTEIETDAMGNPVKITSGTNLSSNTEPIVKTLTWGEGRMLLGISRDEDNHIAYTYNADGLRSQQVVTKDGVSTTTKYIWGNHGLAAVITDERTVVLLYDDEGEAVGFYVQEEPQPSATLALGRIPIPKQTDFVYTYVKNLQGDVIQIIDEDGDAVVKYTYDPWGVPTVHGDDDLAAINPCSYRGYYYDEETGYYYLRSRYYDPEIGRFINADDIGALGIGGTVVGLNLVLYCENCPIAEDDQSGYGPILAFGIQFTITIGKLTLGLEALWKQSSRQFYLFGFIGGTRTIDLAFLKSKEAGLIQKILSLLRSLTKLSLSSFSLFKGLGISVSFIVVLGNRYASFPRSYCGWFTGFSASFYHVAISGAYAVSGKMGIGSVGIGVTSSAASIGLSQTYYFQLTGNDALANNLAEAKTSIYNKVAWLRLFGFWH